MDMISDQRTCQKRILAVRDTLDVVGGKWKLVLLTILMTGARRFQELSREAGITPRILSKELKELEMHGLVNRTLVDSRPVKVAYSLTPYSQSLEPVLAALHEWGINHRQKFIGSSEI